MRNNSIEDVKGWPEGLLIFIRCTLCNEFMDNPHCTKAGCPWCLKCSSGP